MEMASINNMSALTLVMEVAIYVQADHCREIKGSQVTCCILTAAIHWEQYYVWSLKARMSVLCLKMVKNGNHSLLFA